MAEIRPFRALRYAPDRVPVSEVVTQPYDKISPQMREDYLSSHSNNLVRILLPDSYSSARSLLGEWLRDGVIAPISEPAIFAYFQSYTPPDEDSVRTRKGFISRIRLEDYANGVVFPHEGTLSGPKQDRLELLRHTRTHFGQVFLLYSDPGGVVDTQLDGVASAEPDLEVVDEYGVEHRLWSISDPGRIGFLQREMREKQMVIADGHHRYETALAFRDEERLRLSASDAGGAEWLMTTMVSMDSPGLTILPTHRVMSGLASFDPGRLLERVRAFFDVDTLDGVDDLERRLAAGLSGPPSIGVGLKDQVVLLQLRRGVDLAQLMPDVSSKQTGLDVVILHRLILARCLDITEADVRDGQYLEYVRGTERALDAVRSDGAQVCFLLNPTRIEQVRDIAFGGEVLPQKSTDFYPKMLSGLTMYSIDEGASP